MTEYKSEAYAKCIIAGEHSVLRGCPALVVPVKKCALNSYWNFNKENLEIEFSGKYGSELALLFSGVLDRACKNLNISRGELQGHWHLNNEIQLGGGLGASAAICVTIARYFVARGQLQESEVYKFAQTLENMFHGESSGVDIAASMSQNPLRFSRSGGREFIEPCWQPYLYLSYSGHKGLTADCVEQVKNLIEQNPQRAKQVDDKMQEAVSLACQSLEIGEKLGFEMLKNSLFLAKSCFQEWGL
ncbi:MAG: hypothetical protein KDD40_05475, partial [Bdellovibrionales bacterium]|nr:hypothetical protein [Bdellovibrionales bacterium]